MNQKKIIVWNTKFYFILFILFLYIFLFFILFFYYIYIFFYGKLNKMGNLAGWRYEARMHELCGILTWRTCQAMNINARVKLHIYEAKLCNLFSLVPRASAFPWHQGALCWWWSYCTLLRGYLFSFLQKVSGQQIL